MSSLPLMNVHIISARDLPKPSSSASTVFVVVKYKGVQVGSTQDCDDIKRPNWDEHFVVTHNRETQSINGVSGNSTQFAHSGTPDHPEEDSIAEGATESTGYAAARGLTLEVWVRTATQTPQTSFHDRRAKTLAGLTPSVFSPSHANTSSPRTATSTPRMRNSNSDQCKQSGFGNTQTAQANSKVTSEPGVALSSHRRMSTTPPPLSNTWMHTTDNTLHSDISTENVGSSESSITQNRALGEPCKDESDLCKIACASTTSTNNIPTYSTNVGENVSDERKEDGGDHPAVVNLQQDDVSLQQEGATFGSKFTEYTALAWGMARSARVMARGARRRLKTAVHDTINSQVPAMEMVGRCIIGPRVLKELMLEPEPVELRLWRAGSGWRGLGLIRARITSVRLQVWLLGAKGFSEQSSRCRVRVTWRGRELPVPQQANWATGFCLRPQTNGRLVVRMEAPVTETSRAGIGVSALTAPETATPQGPPETAIEQEGGKVTLEVGRAMHLSTHDAEGLAEVLNSATRSTEAGTSGWLAAGFRILFDATKRQFIVFNINPGSAFILDGAFSTMATELLGFSRQDHKSQLSTDPLPDPQGGGTLACREAVWSDIVPQPLRDPNWQQVVWGPSTIEILQLGGDFAVEVWGVGVDVPAVPAKETITKGASASVPPPLKRSPVSKLPTGPGALFRRRERLLGSATLTAEQLCALATGKELPLSMISRRYRRWRAPPQQPPTVVTDEALSPGGGGTTDGEDGCVGTIRVALRLRDQSQLMVRVLQRWTMPRDERAARERRRAAAEAKRLWMLMPGRGVRRAAWDLLSLVLLLGYAAVMAAQAYHRQKCSQDWQCEASSDPSLVDLSIWQSGLDTLLTLFSVLDIIFIFRTGYVAPDGSIVVDPTRVAIRYLSTWFLLDALCGLPNDALKLLLGDEWLSDQVHEKIPPEAPLALLVHNLGRVLHWKKLNTVRNMKGFQELDRWLAGMDITRRGVVGFIQGRRAFLREILGIPAPRRSTVGKIKNITSISKRWTSRVLEYKLLSYVKLAGSIIRSSRLVFRAICLLPRMARFLRLTAVVVHSMARHGRGMSDSEAVLLLQRRVRAHAARRLASFAVNSHRVQGRKSASSGLNPSTPLPTPPAPDSSRKKLDLQIETLESSVNLPVTLQVPQGSPTEALRLGASSFVLTTPVPRVNSSSEEMVKSAEKAVENSSERVDRSSDEVKNLAEKVGENSSEKVDRSDEEVKNPAEVVAEFQGRDWNWECLDK